MRTTRVERLKKYLLQDVADDLSLEIQLMGLALAAGINDATTFPDYHVFASNQTGNTALLAVGALDWEVMSLTFGMSVSAWAHSF